MCRWHLVMLALLVAGCSTAPAPRAASSAGSCGSTPVLRGALPVWLNKPGNPVDLPYVLANPPQAAAFLFAQPLRAGHPENPSNKILWEVDALPYGPSLDLVAHPTGSSTPSISQSVGFLPSGDLPSIVDVPQAACWHFDLSWSGHRASVDLLYK